MQYPGGKNGSGSYQKIINQIPPHRIYLEPFLGSGAVFRRIRPAEVSIGLDIDPKTISEHSPTRAPVKSLVDLLPRGKWIGLGCALKFLQRAELKEDCFVYLDPPYLQGTRKSSVPIYRHEFATEEEHSKLLDLATSTRAMVAISGYNCELYEQKLKDWRRVDYQASTRQGLVTESLWCNYPEPKELHDYRFLGTDRTDRQRIKRKKERFVAKLERMPVQERYAILSALQDWRMATADGCDYDRGEDTGRVDETICSCSSRHF